MVNNASDILTSKEYRFLNWLAEQPCIELNGNAVIRMSQPQLAEAFGVSATTIFHWIENLKKVCCVAIFNKKSGYIVTPVGHMVIKKMKELENVVCYENTNTNDTGKDAIQCVAHANTYVDFFSGCGGLSLGLGFANWKGIFAIEKDPMAYSTFAYNLISSDSPYSHFNDWPKWLPQKAHDIEDIMENPTIINNLKKLRGRVTLVAGGPPCQGFSVAGARNGNDPRNLLVFRQIQAIELIKPIYAIIENVGGFEKKFVCRPLDGMAISVADEAIIELEKLGYSVGKVTINAADYGVPQIRKRVILFAISEKFVGSIYAAELLQDILGIVGIEQRTELNLSTNRYVNIEEAISDLAGNVLVDDSEFAGYKTCNYLPAQSSYQRLLRKNIPGQRKPTCHRFNNHSKKVIDLYEKAHATQPAGRLSKEFLYENGCHSNKRFVLDTSKPCSTLTTAPEELIHYKYPRVVTLREMARLQSFPDDFTFLGRYTLNGPARGVDVPRNAQIGNAIPPLVGRALGISLEKITHMILRNDNVLDKYRK